MHKFILFAHGGSGNHGCEALVRSTIKILKQNNITLISSHPEEDVKYGVDEICTIIKDTQESFTRYNLDFIKAYISLKLKNNYLPMERLRYKKAFDCISKGDIALSIGGDNYCYADVEKYIMMHDMLIERGAKTVLWGCSIEPEIALREDISTDLARYDLITARESITYDVLKKINGNTYLVSDPAFQLDVEKTDLPENFIAGNTVGINLSPMALDNEKIEGITWANYESLIDHIIENTDMNIALIPHVVWNDNDDRIPLNKLYEKYKSSERICMIEDNICTKLKYIISQCRFFIGARTHSTIAAYSTGVPTIVLGYSVKSRGIAKDLFGTEVGYVLSVQNLKKNSELLELFIKLINQEKENKKRLSSINKDYTKVLKELI